MSDDDTDTYYFEIEDNKICNIRISGENFVTFVDTFTKTADFSLEITLETLSSAGTDKKAVDKNLSSNSGYNVADIYLNTNEKGYLKLDNTGDAYKIVNLRNWEAVNSTTANYFIEPDYQYTVIDKAGNASEDVITINENGLITAVGEGSAIVLVTYDAMNAPYALGGPFFGALWPENTGVFVVSVGAGESGIVTNMTVPETYTNAIATGAWGGADFWHQPSATHSAATAPLRLKQDAILILSRQAEMQIWDFCPIFTFPLLQQMPCLLQ